MNRRSLEEGIKNLASAYFALVMSTGILSIGAHLLGFPLISQGLFWLTNSEYIVLFLLLILRILFFFPYFRADLASPAKGAGFFTVVAGSCVLGIQYQLLEHRFVPALLLWLVALVAWLVLIYVFLLLVITNPRKPAPTEGLNGSWLLLVVSTQSIAILGTLLVPRLSLPVELVLFTTLSLFLLGFTFYLILVSLIMYRLAFLPIQAEELTPPYWIDMGAMAITTLAGATLLQTTKSTAILVDFSPFLKGISLLAWVTATWWIPLLVLLGGWRHLKQKMPLTYNSQYWSMVFTLGMYTVCTWRLAESLELTFLRSISQAAIYVALVVWTITFVGMCRYWLKSGASTPI